MNLSNVLHAGLALLMQAIVAGAAIGLGVEAVSAVAMGAFLGIGFYWGREVAQSERKLGTPPWWSGLDIRKWSQDAILDLVCPLVVCSAAVALVWVAA